jgi:hypothetical protein
MRSGTEGMATRLTNSPQLIPSPWPWRIDHTLNAMVDADGSPVFLMATRKDVANALLILRAMDKYFAD